MNVKPKFVFDTNLIISATLISSSLSNKALKAAERLGIIYYSDETFAELTSVLFRSKFDKYLTVKERLDLLDRIKIRYQKVKTVSQFTNCRDFKDNMFLNLIVDINADCLISGDKDLLVLHPFLNIPIITAPAFLAQYEK
ncbi:MAG: putative toxin-antitoxin system toxin component, PIN family [Sphingobacteriaceae bacterium]|nr:MAG: putative toxin-antitoxin system toxin component, PIN family [Sphingobacteriaceae bacterium]